MQIVADILQAPVRQLKGHPGSSLGAAWTAAIGTGAATDWSGISAFIENGELIAPRPENAEIYDRGYQRFREIYADLKPLYKG